MSEDRLNIMYRDDRYIAVDKPSGLLVHRTAVDRSETRFCIQILRDQTGARVYPCHRLDKPTSGILLFALDREALGEMNRQFMSHGVSKKYIAIVRGWTDPAGTIDHPLSHVADGGKSRGGGLPQDAVTEYSLVRRYESPVATGKFPTSRYSMVELRPLTGRQHQLRRHMKHVFHPVIGDTRYGDGAHNRYFREKLGIHRLMLHATELVFTRPATGETVQLHCACPAEFDIPLPIVQ